jgi:L-aminopeptidase/D-esterase-like protein
VLFDLQGMEPVWPDAALGYAACEAARETWPGEGQVGAGSGATVGKILGREHASAGGVGGASLRLPGGITVGAFVAVNAFGHVIDPADGRIIAGPHGPDGFGNTVDIMLSGEAAPPSNTADESDTNTTIGVIWTDARLDKAGCSRIAGVAHDGLARTIRPVHTPYDGDTLFALSLPADDAPPGDLVSLGVAATEVVAAAVVRAVTATR